MNLNHEQIAAIFNEWARQVVADKGSFGIVLDDSGAPPAGYGEACARHFERIANDIIAEPDDGSDEFKAYVHNRLDEMGVPHSVPESEHDKAGCRIGGRLDWVEGVIKQNSVAIAEPESKPEIDYSEMVAALAKPGDEILESLSSDDCHSLHMVIGISGEAGELLDAVKKAVIYRKPLDLANVIEELGDIEFYMEGLRQGLGITRDMCIKANIYKLALGPKARYKGGVYSDKAAQERKDKE